MFIRNLPAASTLPHLLPPQEIHPQRKSANEYVKTSQNVLKLQLQILSSQEKQLPKIKVHAQK